MVFVFIVLTILAILHIVRTEENIKDYTLKAARKQDSNQIDTHFKGSLYKQKVLLKK